MERNCSSCNVKIDQHNYKYQRTICKDCYNIKKQKYNKKHVIQQPKNENVSNSNNKNRTLIVGFSNCGKAYLLNHILFQKQEPIFIFT